MKSDPVTSRESEGKRRKRGLGGRNVAELCERQAHSRVFCKVVDKLV